MIDEKALQSAMEATTTAGQRGNLRSAPVPRVVLEAAITAYLQALRPGSTGETDGWQPIETAPKDGTRILLWDGEQARTAEWTNDNNRIYGGGWLEAHGAEGWQNWSSEVYTATHWRPLPSPPSAMLAAAGGRDE